LYRPGSAVIDPTRAGQASYREPTATAATPSRDLSAKPLHEPSDSVDEAFLDQHLERICASPEFIRADRIAALLLFVARQSNAGKGTELKERLVGERIFNRPKDWDPKLDPIVRTAAGRLRTKLESYYRSLGREDQLRIHVPKGRYLAQFEVLRPLPQPHVAEEEIVPEARAVANPLLLWFILAGSVLLATLVVGWLWRERYSSQDKRNNFTIVPFATELGEEFSPAISPNGRWVAYVWDGNAGNYDIYLKSQDGKLRRRLTTNSAGDLYPAWSPDGNTLAFIRVDGTDQSLMTVPVNGGDERKITNLVVPDGGWAGEIGPLLGNPGPAWMPDGKEVVVFDRSMQGLCIVSLATGKKRALTQSGTSIDDFYPRISPDGKSIAFIRYSTHGVGELYLMPLSSGVPRALTSFGRAIRGLSWTPDSQSLVFASDRGGGSELWSIDASGKNLNRVFSNSSSVSDLSIAPDAGSLAFVEQHENWNIWRLQIKDGKLSVPQLFLSSSGRNHSPRHSPDGSRIAFVSDRSGSWEIWLCSQDGSNLTQLTHFHGPWIGGLTWSPDGKRIAFDVRIKGHASVYVVPSIGGASEPLEESGFEEKLPSWSMDGSSIYFSSNREGKTTIYRRDLSSGATIRVVNEGIALETSPDGASLYYVAPHGVLTRSSLDGGNAVVLPVKLQPYGVLSWTLFDHGFYVLSEDAQSGALHLLRGTKDDRMEPVGSLHVKAVWYQPNIDASPDGHTLLIVQQDRIDSDIFRREGMIN
jgi:Tol biopolymer transport system component